MPDILGLADCVFDISAQFILVITALDFLEEFRLEAYYCLRMVASGVCI